MPKKADTPAKPEEKDQPEAPAVETSSAEDLGPRVPERPEQAEGAEPLVLARWHGADPVFNPEQGLIRPGDGVWMTPEQLEDPETPATAFEEGE